MSRRTRQLGEFVKEEVMEIVRREVNDPRIGFMSITRVDVSDDLRSARIFVSVFGTDEEREETMKALRSAAGYIRRLLKPRMHTRQIPELDFRDDRSMEHAASIARTLNEVRAASPSKSSDEGPKP
jgi:ribosome-binding factor A